MIFSLCFQGGKEGGGGGAYKWKISQKLVEILNNPDVIKKRLQVVVVVGVFLLLSYTVILGENRRNIQ